MFTNLRKSRSLLMGLAILGIIFFHAPFIIHNSFIRNLHHNLYCGVETFLLISGIGACHSIAAHGSTGYLKQRIKRLVPILLPVLVIWGLIMFALGFADIREFFGIVTLLGFWWGQTLQLNWYFSCIWLFFLLAVVAYWFFRRCKYPLLVWAVLMGYSIFLFWLNPFPHLNLMYARLPIFFTGMLLGRLEQTGFRRENLLRGILYSLMVLGILLYRYLYWNYCETYGDSLGLWWYPYLLIIPGAAFLISDIAVFLRKYAVFDRIIGLLEIPGKYSAELLAVHMAVYKVFNWITDGGPGNKPWLVVFLSSIALGIGYGWLAEKIRTRYKLKTA